MNSEKYKQAFSNIYVANKLEQSILDKTVNKKRQKESFLKLAHGLSFLIIFSFFSISIVYAEQIKDYFYDFTKDIVRLQKNLFKDKFDYQIPLFTIVDENANINQSLYTGVKAVDIKKTAIINEKQSYILMSVDETEKMLGVDFLVSYLAENNDFKYNTCLVDSKIAKVDLFLDDFIDYSQKNKEIGEQTISDEIKKFKKAENERKVINQSITFLTKYAGENYLELFSGEITTMVIEDGKKEEIIDYYYINSLNMEVQFIYENGWFRTKSTVFNKIIAVFVYDNILYTFIGNNISTLEMIEILETLH